MKTTLITLAVALALGAAAGCDRTPEQRTPATPSTSSTTPPPAGTGGTASRESNTPTAPAPTGQAQNPGTQPPVQGQVDPKPVEQRKDFQQKGDGAGPKPGG